MTNIDSTRPTPGGMPSAADPSGRTDVSGERTLDKVQHRMSEGLDRFRESAEDTAERQKDKAADRLHDVAGSIRAAVSELHRHDDPIPARYVEYAADRLDATSSYLHERSVGELVSEAADLAQKHPAVFLGTALAAGVVVGRFLRSSTPNVPPHDGRRAASARGFEPAGARERQTTSEPSRPSALPSSAPGMPGSSTGTGPAAPPPGGWRPSAGGA